MKLISWNVNGLRAVMRKMDFLSYLKEEDADIICLQETKIQDGQVDLQPEGYHVYWNYAVKKGYSGTAVFSKQEPLQVIYGIGVEEHDQEGRVITLEFENVFVITVYTPNSRRGLERIDYRMQWEEALLSYILELDQKKPVILCGDLNVAHQEIDLKNPKANRNNAGFSDQEREAFTRFLKAGFVDSFRHVYPDLEGAYFLVVVSCQHGTEIMDGGLIILLFLKALRNRLKMPAYQRTSWVPTIVLLNLSSIYDEIAVRILHLLLFYMKRRKRWQI